jgi:hypothetical protein
MATMGKIVLLPDVVSAYDWTGSGISSSAGSLHRKKIIAVQFIQFIHCSHKQIADYYYKKLPGIFSHMYSFKGCGGTPYPLNDRKIFTKMIRSIARSRGGILSELKMMFRCYRKLYKAWRNAYFPCLAHQKHPKADTGCKF